MNLPSPPEPITPAPTGSLLQTLVALCLGLILFTGCQIPSGPTPGAESRKPNPMVIFNHPGPFVKRGDYWVWTSDILAPEQPFTEVVASWNLTPRPGEWIQVEVQGVRFGERSRFYNLGQWTAVTNLAPRRSFNGQKDAWATVATDTLKFNQVCTALRTRVTIGGTATEPAPLRFLGFSVGGAAGPNSSTRVLGEMPAQDVQPLAVPVLCQLDYPGGNVWCSPTSVTMLLSYWGKRLRRPELERQVPEVAGAVYDPEYKGTGNWSFNMAYAGAFPGIRAYATRARSLEEVAGFLRAGVPVALSVCYNKLRGREGKPSGHLVVCVGFDSEGQVIINDPGSREFPRRTFSRERVESAWDHSNRTIYVIHPEGWTIPGQPRT